MIYSIFYLTNALSVVGVLALSTSWFYSFSHVSSERKTEIPSLLEIGNSGSSFINSSIVFQIHMMIR